MIVTAVHPEEFSPPGGQPRSLDRERSGELFRAVLAASTAGSIGDGFIGIRVHRDGDGDDGPIRYEWQFADHVDRETAQAYVQIMLDKAARPVLGGARWRPEWR